MSPCRIALVGEAWGEKEEMFEHAFVGSSGRELARMIGEAGLAPPPKFRYPSELEMIKHWKDLRDNHGIWLFNVFNGRPPDNNFDEMFLVPKAECDVNICVQAIKPGRYAGVKLAPHVINLRDELALFQPNLTICLGNIACVAVLGEARITSIRGTVTTSRFCNDIKVLPTYHPAHILRNWPLRIVALADFQKGNREADFPELRRIQRWITIEPTLAEISAWFAAPASSYAIDIESGQALFTRAELKAMTPIARKLLAEQISMVGFARDKNNALVVPFMTRNEPDLNYWKFKDHEVKAWRLVKRAVAKSIPKIFQNGMYDIPMLLTYGIVPRQMHEDTMLMHHSLFPEQLKGLGFLGSIYANAPSWKNAYGKGEAISLKKDA